MVWWLLIRFFLEKFNFYQSEVTYYFLTQRAIFGQICMIDATFYGQKEPPSFHGLVAKWSVIKRAKRELSFVICWAFFHLHVFVALLQLLPLGKKNVDTKFRQIPISGYISRKTRFMGNKCIETTTYYLQGDFNTHCIIRKCFAKYLRINFFIFFKVPQIKIFRLE